MTDLSEDDKKSLEPIFDYFDGDYEKYLHAGDLEEGEFDLKLMEEIIKLAKSQNVKDRLQVLDLIEKSSNSFPFGFEENLLIALKKDSSEQVREKAAIVDRKRREKSAEKLKTNIGELSEIYRDAFKANANIINSTLQAFTLSQEIAERITPLIDQAVRSINPNIFESYLKAIESIRPALSSIETASSTIASTEQIIQSLVDQEKSYLTVAQVLDKSQVEITTELKELASSDEDILFNYEGYPLLCDLERFLRVLITQRICEKYPKLISNKIHEKDLEKWRERRTAEESHHFMKKGYRLIEYSDFSDIKRIFEKGKNKEEFLDLLNFNQFNSLITKLDELDPIRKKIAHSRSLSKSEFVRLKMYADDISSLLSGGAKS